MSERARFWLISGFLIFTVAICMGVRVDVIERDLLARTQEALGAAGIAFYGVGFEGRDAVLHGFVSSPEQADRIDAIVAAVEGVRTVGRSMAIERIPEPERSAPAVLPVLRLQRLGDRLFLAGRFPDDGSHRALVAAAEERFGKANVSTDLRANAAVASSQWVDRAAALVEIMEKLEGNGRLSIQGDTALLFGQVRDRTDAVEVRALTDSIGPLRWSLDLTVLDAIGTGTGGGA